MRRDIWAITSPTLRWIPWTYCQWWGSVKRWCVFAPCRGSWTERNLDRGPRRPGPGPRTAPCVCCCLTTWGTPSGPRKRALCQRSSGSASPAAEPRRSPNTAGSTGGPSGGRREPASGPAAARHTCSSAQTLWPQVGLCSGALGPSAEDATQASCFYWLSVKFTNNRPTD